jgi:hypothetical protein
MARIKYVIPMERDETIARVKEREAEPKSLGVQHFCLFGSIASGRGAE